jgi:Common central domain of tyrosinase/Bacterial Ig domain
MKLIQIILAIFIYLSVSIFGFTLLPSAALAQADLFMRDRPVDTGAEPYVGPDPIYISEDVWIRNDPDPNFSPYPFNSVSPSWTPLSHQNPEYRDPLTGRPNYIYARVTNRGDQPSNGIERLRIYQSKASTGLAWPTNWVDHMDMSCGQSVLHGIEVTKPRRNAKSVLPAERTRYLNALLRLQSDSTLRYSDGIQFWRKQNDIHAGTGNPEHGNPAFLPWHREMVNRFEQLLKKADPLVSLLYWDWSEDPRVGTNLFTTDFMGESNGTVASPLVPLRPPTLNRGVASFSFSPTPDATLQTSPNYETLADDIEAVPNHNSAHGFIGGSFGQLGGLNTSVQDPFFFQLHGNVDRLWANWQRNPMNLDRLDPVAAYAANAGNPRINDTMSPWDGNTGMAPWTTTSYSKTSKSRSVVNPPIYDTAPLTIPILQPGESVILEIPWYPPNVADFNCNGESGHFCLLARIETQATFPFGMAFPEGNNVGTNTRNNNNIVWKNLTVVDNEPDISGTIMIFSTGTMVHNIFEQEVPFTIRLRDRTLERKGRLFEVGRIGMTLSPDITKRVMQNREAMQGIEVSRDPKTDEPIFFAVKEDAQITIPLKPKERAVVGIRAEFPMRLERDLRAQPFLLDIEQMLPRRGDAFVQPREEELVVGGVRLKIDLSKIKLVEAGSEWLESRDREMLLAKELPRQNTIGTLDLPLDEKTGKNPVRLLLKQFSLGAPDQIETLHLKVKANDAAAVFLNGKEIFRHNLPEGEVVLAEAPLAPQTPLDSERTFVAKVDPGLLHEGKNLITAMVIGRKADMLGFDLELTANEVDPGVAPDVTLALPEGRTTFAPGEPIDLALFADDQDSTAPQVVLRIDGEQRLQEQERLLRDTVRFNKPGIHEIEVMAVDDQGKRMLRIYRILVAEDMPPNAVITSPKNGGNVLLGESVDIVANVNPAYGRKVTSVRLYAKSDGRIATGTNLPKSGNYKVLDEATAPPYRLTFRPKKSGTYMLQIGATDDKGVIGVSRHLKLIVR